jgi:hypothetical protein
MSECILFTGCKDTGGYGLKRYKNKLYKAHRFVWIQTFGEIPDGLFVCHKCDVRACINPEHLFLGTNSDNMKDMYSKGRGNNLRGDNNPCAKLTKEQVNEIRVLLTYPITLTQIASKYNVDRSLIGLIKANKIWK